MTAIPAPSPLGGGARGAHSFTCIRVKVNTPGSGSFPMRPLEGNSMPVRCADSEGAA